MKLLKIFACLLSFAFVMTRKRLGRKQGKSVPELVNAINKWRDYGGPPTHIFNSRANCAAGSLFGFLRKKDLTDRCQELLWELDQAFDELRQKDPQRAHEMFKDMPNWYTKNTDLKVKP